MSKSPRVIILFEGRYPSERAAAIFTEKNLQSLNLCDLDVSLLVSRRKTNKYKIEENLVKSVGLPILLGFQKFHGLQQVLFGFFCLKYDKFRQIRNSNRAGLRTVFLSNEIWVLAIPALFGQMCVLEVHDYIKKNWLTHLLVNRMKIIVATNSIKQSLLFHDFGLEKKKVLLLRSAADQEFKINAPHEETLEILKAMDDFLNLGKKILLYTGSFQKNKNLKILLESAESCPDIIYFLVGGEREVLLAQYGKEVTSNILIFPFIPNSQIRFLQSKSTALVITEDAEDLVSSTYTSPMKFVEYLVTQKPVLAPSLPALQDFPYTRNVHWYDARDPQSLTSTTRLALEALEANPLTDLEIFSFSWKFRAQKLSKAISDLLG